MRKAGFDLVRMLDGGFSVLLDGERVGKLYRSSLTGPRRPWVARSEWSLCDCDGLGHRSMESALDELRRAL